MPDSGSSPRPCRRARFNSGCAGRSNLELNLKDKVVIVTGGAAGIGRATVERFRAEGAIAIPWDVTIEPKVDVTKRESIERAVEDVIKKHGRIDVLVNNAGIL